MAIKDEGYHIEEIDHKLADIFLKSHHYLAQQGNGFMSLYNFGLFDKQEKLLGVLTFSGISVIETLIGAFENKSGEPFSRESDQKGFYELSRLAMVDDERKVKNLTSWFVGGGIKLLRKLTKVRAIISYADSKYHHGYIYQATNWRYYGLAPQKSDFFYKDENGIERQLWRGKSSDKDGEWRPRSRKHRYLLLYDKSLTVKWKEEPYPKGDNDCYEITQPKQIQMTMFD